MKDNTPAAFLEYIKNSSFDYSSLHLWEIETLSSYLILDKVLTQEGEQDDN